MSKRRNGEGSWGKKKVGKNTYYYFRDSNNTYTYGKTQNEVKKKLQEKENKFLISNKTTFGEYISNWLKSKQSSVEATTYDCYETMIKSQLLDFKLYDLANQQLHNLTSDSFQKYLNALAQKYSRATIKKIWAIIKQCVTYGEINNEIPANVTKFINLPIESNVKVKKKDVPFLSREDTEKLYQASKLKCNNGVLKFGNNAKAIILILYSGMRVSEMIALKWKNVDLANKKIYVEESAAVKKDRDGNSSKTYIAYDKAPKTVDSGRTIPLPERAIEAILWFDKKYPDHKPSDYVCVTKNKTKIERRNINKTLKRMAEISKCSTTDFSIHSLRHTYGSILLENGVDIKKVSELLGHSDITITYNIYIGVSEKDKQSEVERVFN